MGCRIDLKVLCLVDANHKCKHASSQARTVIDISGLQLALNVAVGSANSVGFSQADIIRAPPL